MNKPDETPEQRAARQEKVRAEAQTALNKALHNDMLQKSLLADKPSESNEACDARLEAERVAARIAAHKAFQKIDWIANAQFRAMQATDMQAKFKAARAAGFTDAEALFLCNKTWEM